MQMYEFWTIGETLAWSWGWIKGIAIGLIVYYVFWKFIK